MEEIKYPVNEMMQRYGFFRGQYVLMRGAVINWVKNKFTTRQMWEHLSGNIALCVFAGPSNTGFLSFDIDLPEPEVVRKVIDTLAELGVPRDKIYVSTSGGKGYHVDIFFSRSIYNWLAKELYDLVIFFGGLNPRKVEYRPTATQAIKLPLGIHQKTGNRCWFLDRETLEPIEDFDYIKKTELVDADLIGDIIHRGNRRRFDIMLADALAEEEKTNATAKTSPMRSALNAGATATPASFDITEPGTRQRKMIELALYLYRQGGTYDSIHRDLQDWLYRQNMALISDPLSECLRNIDNITGWVMTKGRRQELGEDTTHEYHRNTRIFESDARRIISAKTRSARLLAFLFTVYCDKYEYCGLGIEKLMEISGIKTMNTIIAATNELVKDGLFWKQRGGLKFRDNTLKKVTNKYRFPGGYERGGEFIEIDGLVDSNNITSIYAKTLAALLSEDELREHLTASELKAVMAENDGGGNDA